MVIEQKNKKGQITQIFTYNQSCYKNKEIDIYIYKKLGQKHIFREVYINKKRLKKIWI